MYLIVFLRNLSIFSDNLILNLMFYCAVGGRFPDKEEYPGWTHGPVHPHVLRRKQGPQPAHPASP